MDEAKLESVLKARAREHRCWLAVDRIDHRGWRVALKALGDDVTPEGAIRLSATGFERHAALQDLYDAGEPEVAGDHTRPLSAVYASDERSNSPAVPPDDR